MPEKIDAGGSQMPIVHEYKCEDCGAVERMQQFDHEVHKEIDDWHGSFHRRAGRICRGTLRRMD